jgi:dTDP-4-dehydrorhamnose 3,5-epimerase
MINENLPIPGLMLIEHKVFHDNRGFFTERFNHETLKALGFEQTFVQDNFSRSLPGVLRGMHYQFDQPQGKLVSCTRGRIYDIAIDLRHTEASFGKYYGIELSGEKPMSLWIPPGFAHGFCVIGDELADVSYKVSCPYNANGEFGLRWNDSQIKIDWPIAKPILSGKDEVAGGLDEYLKTPLAHSQWWLIK